MATAPNINGALITLLAGYREREVAVLLNRGNRGDGLIHLGGRHLLADVGLTYRELHEGEDLTAAGGDVLLVHGAGAMSRRTHSLAKLLPKLVHRFAEVVILPGSFDPGDARVRAFAETWDRRTTVFCREMKSFDALRRAGVRPRALLLGHDLAFHADLSDWARQAGSGRAGFFRRDNEATYSAVPAGLDCYDDPSHGTDREPERLLAAVSRFAEIHTDRCHAAIAGAMMGRKVVLYRNNYFKNRAIYEHSLAGWTNVQFVARAPFSLRQFFRAIYWVRMRPVEMKVRRVFQGSAAPASG